MKHDTLYQLGSTPFSLDVLAAIYPDCKQTGDKARRLEQEGRIVRLKRGMYVRSTADGAKPCPELVANHIYGPSYVSLRTALRHYGLLPERVYATESICLKRSRSFDTLLGRFSYHGSKNPYFAVGVQMLRDGEAQYLIATPEKALCDLMTFTPGLDFRSVKELASFLEQDLRIDTDALHDLNTTLLADIGNTATVKPQNIITLLKMIR